MPVGLNAADFELYYRQTFFPKNGKVYYVEGIRDEGVAVKSGAGWDVREVVPMETILDYVGKFPQAGYRNIRAGEVRYISFTRNGTKKGVTSDGIVGRSNHDNFYQELFYPKYFSLPSAMEEVARVGVAAISSDIMISCQGEKILLNWKGYTVGRVTQKGKTILSKSYEFLVPLVDPVIAVGDLR